MEKEREEDYVWTLSMFKQVLSLDSQPSVIVSEKNILTNCKRYFESQEGWDGFLSSWNVVIQSPSDVDFNRNWKSFEEVYNGKKEIIPYIVKIWLPYNERFVYAWTEKHKHFGNRVSSRAEGVHTKLKKYLLVSTGDFRQVKDKICLEVANEFQELKSKLFSERLRFPHNCNVPFFKELVTNVSMFAMKELYKQYEISIDGSMDPICSNQFMSTMSFPCAHEMMKWKAGVLLISCIHSQWKICSQSLASVDKGVDVDVNFNEVFRELQNDFTKCPVVRKKIALDTISKLTCPSKSKHSEQTSTCDVGLVDDEQVIRPLDLNMTYADSITLLK